MYRGQNIMIFTDRSVKMSNKENLPQTLGYGACSAIIIPIGNNQDVIPSNKHVGVLTNLETYMNLEIYGQT